MHQAELKVVSGKQSGSSIPLPAGKFLIGREEDCHLRPNSDLVSRHHCVFTLDQYALRVRDLGSTNGTLVNGERIRGDIVLKNGDVVAIGKIELEVQLRDASHDTDTHAAFHSDTQVVPGKTPEAAPEPDPILPEVISEGEEAKVDAEAEEPVSSHETMVDLPTTSAAQPGMAPPPSGDTQFVSPSGVPMQGMGYPPQMGYPQQMMPPYGYPPQPYPGMYPQQMMGYPPQMGYPQQMMPPQQQQQPPQQESEPSPSASEPPIRLPDPTTTGADQPVAPQSDDGKEEKMTADQRSKKEAPKKAEDIIQQYLRRRPGGSA